MKIGKTIFLSTGRTFTFRDVSQVVENETSLTFEYAAMSDGLAKKVTFYRPEIVGHSTYKLGEEKVGEEIIEIDEHGKVHGPKELIDAFNAFRRSRVRG